MSASRGSLASLLTAALIVVTLPMLGAVIFSTWNADRQLSESRDLVARAVRVTALGESVDDQVMLLQRSARRYSENGAVSDQKKLHKRQDRLIEVLDDMAAEQPDAAPRQIVSELKSLAQTPMTVAPTDRSVAAAQERKQSETFSEMRELTDDMRQANRRALADRLSVLAEQNATTRQGLILGSVLMVLLAVVLVAVLARLISHPLRQILSGIRRLGRSELGEPIHVSGTAELRQLGQELEWLRERLKNVDEEKNAFLRQVSHDLKTPLTNIKEGGGLLLDGVVSPARSEEIMRIVHRNALKLEALIAQLFDFTAAQQLTQNASFSRCDLATVVHQQLIEHELQIGARDLTVDCQVPGPLLLHGDAERLARLVDNLLSNAIKFSPSGATVQLRATTTADEIALEVRDEGPGFSAEDRIRAFDPFFRGASAVTADVPGTGIGLSVAQACARMHGGAIEIAARPRGVGCGALVRVRLPRRTGAADHGRS